MRVLQQWGWHNVCQSIANAIHSLRLHSVNSNLCLSEYLHLGHYVIQWHWEIYLAIIKKTHGMCTLYRYLILHSKCWAELLNRGKKASTQSFFPSTLTSMVTDSLAQEFLSLSPNVVRREPQQRIQSAQGLPFWATTTSKIGVTRVRATESRNTGANWVYFSKEDRTRSGLCRKTPRCINLYASCLRGL